MENTRDDGIDLLKGLFVIGMVWGHLVDLWSTTNGRAGNIYYALSIVTFSGFLFCFGYAMQLSYSRGRLTLTHALSNTARILIAFYISGIAYELIVHAKDWTPQDLGNVLIIKTLPELSEFLPAFALTSLIGSLLMRPLNWIIASWPRLGLTLFLLLLTTLLPFGWVQSPQLCLLIGCEQNLFTSFPVLQYFIFFLLGMAVAQKNFRFSWIMPIVGVAALGIYLYFHFTQGMARRFPPDLKWILGGLTFLILWYSAARLLERVPLIRDLLVPIGRNTLFYYLFTNLLFFAGRKSFDTYQFGFFTSFLLAFVVLLVGYFFISIVRPAPARKMVPKAVEAAQPKG